QAEIATAMVGRAVLLRVEKKPAKPGAVSFRVENLTALSDRGVQALKGVSFELRQGEILGIAGVEGNGQSELVEVLAGTRKVSGGSRRRVSAAGEMARPPRVLLATQRTRGVDIGAIEFIHRRVVAARAGGAAVLLVSAELDEVRSLSARIAVMYEGRIVSIEP